MYIFLMILSISIDLSLPHELCKSENGSMTLYNETKVLAKFKNENGQITILVDENREKKLKGINEKFSFTCQNLEDNNRKNLFFGNKKANITKNGTMISGVLKNFDLDYNELGTNTEPIIGK